MAKLMHSTRPLAGLKRALRQCRIERQQRRAHTESTSNQQRYPSLQPRYPPAPPSFRPSQAIKQNRFEEGFRKIRVFPPPPSTIKTCHDPIAKVFADQLRTLDPTGRRTRLFSSENPERAKAGDVLMVRLKSGDTFAGVCLTVRKRHSPIDTAILLRNHLTRLGVEMWYKIYSPNIEGIEIVQRSQKRARRAKLYFMRDPQHDMGSVDGIVRQYQRQRPGTRTGNTRGRNANAQSK